MLFAQVIRIILFHIAGQEISEKPTKNTFSVNFKPKNNFYILDAM